MPQNKQSGDSLTMSGAVNFLYIIARAHATCLTVFLRSGFGREALGLPGLIGLVMMLGYMSFGRVPDMLPFIGIWLLLFLYRRVETARIERKGQVNHSRYGGYPELAKRLVPWTKGERVAVQVVEPMLCLAVGAALCGTVSEAVGWFVMMGSLSLTITAAIELQLVRAQLQQMRDGEIQMRNMSALYREGSDDYRDAAGIAVATTPVS